MNARLSFLLFFAGIALAKSALDPTRPAWSEPVAGTNTVTATKETAVMTISGILYGKDRQLVLLNNRYYRVGERIGQQRITRIERDRIWLKNVDASALNSNAIVMILPRVADIQKSKKAAAHE